ncbi:MAG: DUF4446 family protein [Candidatus Staskawiczbacteria bacterium]|jgi:hypothetical protein
MDILLIFLIILGVAMLIVNIFLLTYFYRTTKQIDNLLEKGKIKEFKEVFLSQKNKNDSLEEQIKEAFLKIKNLENISEITIRKVGVVRFNPFNNMGGNQSFIVAMLDNKNNGFIISSLFVNDSNRVYAKSIKQGKSDHTLSEEEVEAVNKAIRG